MSYQLNEEQKMIQAMVKDLAREAILPTAAERDKTKEFPADIIKQMGELGLMGMSVPPENWICMRFYSDHYVRP